ncbi:hypothetical protein SAMN05444671_0813 [Flavobacterium sp. CF108]|uniref:hypothetical protein n=1 Tax=unclassified Flavobacterium TaxID=196869 RepID=UPI0008B490B8|nr:MULTISPECIES: hypothetical protein [unclassified Flavobacterium]SEO16659.1 hypothetical protein SAMN04487978_2265 [Flavobacterium sp. fv08]SHG56424.1 hypothetical protein SAMN05444671_0813 [Flavobacterium sp. CF108]
MKTNPNQSVKNLNSNDLAYSAKISTPNGEKDIQSFQIGDSILAFSAKLESGTVKLTASQAKVSFSNDIECGKQTRMIYLNLMDPQGSSKNITCSADQLFLLSNGKYAPASQLHPGQELVNKEGNPIHIKSVKAGSFRGCIHSISTNAAFGDIPNGHLFVANDIIMGDFSFQLYFDNLPDEFKQ